jgi:arylsulfatase A-like enzyme
MGSSRGALALAALAVLLCLWTSADTAVARPNILLILTDDQRAAGTMEVMPQTRGIFEDGGTKFTQAFVTTPLCCPSRSSIFSGRYVHNHGVVNNESSQSLDTRYTIQEYLRQSGYRTGYFGKYLNGWNLLRNPISYDDWAISSAGYTNFRANENGVVKAISTYATTYFKDNAIRFINESEAQDATPWFLQISTTAPHPPFQAEPLYANAAVPPFNQPPSYYEADKRDQPVYIQNQNDDPETIEASRIGQLRTLMSVDDLVGQVFGALDANGETSDTLAIFMSDNGYEWGEHGLDFKEFAYDESVRVPMYVRWPGHVVPGTVDSRLAANIDVAPTIVDAVGGLPVSAPMDGRSVIDPAQNRPRLLQEHASISGEQAWAAIQTQTSHYIETYSPDGQTIRFREYYDLTSDPFEMNNLLGDGNAANDPNTAALSAQLAKDRGCTGTNCP